MVKTMWLLIVLWTPENGKHNYYLKDPVRNYHISATLDNKLPYNEGSWIKVKVNMECEHIHTNHIVGISTFLRNDHFCNAKEITIENCNENNSIIVNGIRYC